MLAKKVPLHELDDRERYLSPASGTRYMSSPAPRYELPDEEMPANVVYQLIRDELNLDGNPALNLATFVTTWMEPEADRLMMESLGKNFIDETSRYLGQAIEAMDRFQLLSKPGGLPVVAMRLRDGLPYTVFDISARLREREWIVPAYTLAPNAQDIAALRIVVREGMSRDMAGSLIEDLQRVVASLDRAGEGAGSVLAGARAGKTRGAC